MSTTKTRHDEIQAFGEAFNYDTSYMLDLLEASPGGFEAFRAAQGLGAYRDQY